MPKVDKLKKTTDARSAAHPISRPATAKSASKKKKSTNSSAGSHSESLGDEIDKLANPGKLKPIKPTTVSKKATKKEQLEEQKFENETLTAARFKSNAHLYEDGEDDDMDADDVDDDEADEMARDEAAPISARMSKKILEQVHAQQREELEGEGIEEERQGSNTSAGRLKKIISLSSTVDNEDDMSDADEEEEEEIDLDDGLGDVELSAEDQASLEMFMPKSNTMKSKTLADIILEKIREKEAAASGQPTHGSNVRFGPGFGMPATASTQDVEEVIKSKIDPKIQEVYTKVGKFMSHYTSGKIPKAFKLIPNLKSWEEILFLTAPDQWSVQAYFVATKIFSSNFNPKMAQRFYSLILLPKIRNDIESNKHLNFHLYQSIKKCLYKPAAFFKGLLLPLAEESASAREAVIMSSILAKCTIPVLHSSVALMKLSQLPYSGTTALFIKTLLNKKYSLPRKVIAGLVQYFCGFLHKSAAGAAVGSMPLIWHQTLLTFVQRYKFELTPNQITALKNLIKVQSHHGISNEIRRELAAVAQLQANGGVQVATATGSSKIEPFTFGATGFTSLAAAVQNPTQFNIPTANGSTTMEQ